MALLLGETEEGAKLYRNPNLKPSLYGEREQQSPDQKYGRLLLGNGEQGKPGEEGWEGVGVIPKVGCQGKVLGRKSSERREAGRSSPCSIGRKNVEGQTSIPPEPFLHIVSCHIHTYIEHCHWPASLPPSSSTDMFFFLPSEHMTGTGGWCAAAASTPLQSLPASTHPAHVCLPTPTP